MDIAPDDQEFSKKIKHVEQESLVSSNELWILWPDQFYPLPSLHPVVDMSLSINYYMPIFDDVARSLQSIIEVQCIDL